MRRWAKRLAGAFLVFAAVLAAPVVWIEGACTTRREPGTLTRVPLVDEPGYARPEANSYLSFPEWHVVHVYEDLAGVLRLGDESDFAYGRQIGAFWKSVCRLNRVVTARGRVGADTKAGLYATGWRFTADLAIKGAYEKTVGRVFERLRGPGKTAEDEFAARDLQAYAEFLRESPWHEYPFGWRLLTFWRSTPLRGDDPARKVERRAVFTLEYGAKALSGALGGYASTTAPGAADPEIHTVVVGLDPHEATRDSRITIVRELGRGRTLIRTPGGQVYTDVLVGLARRGRDVAEIAGNHRILVTVLAPKGPLPPLPGTTELFETPIQSRPDRRRVGLDVSVEHLAAAIRSMEAAGTSIEHIHDY
ncbi:MAG: hypothetical protein ACREKG_01170 [Candidatus Rokuibacteriota bacterium]